ncbi:MAG: hypothetical protein KatS3mg111_3514 [Pirellulaceae bacterium]|nr:MAG: hypothetical protein KatS3mg111_3514 [Pirellulaceae bacterium]
MDWQITGWVIIIVVMALGFLLIRLHEKRRTRSLAQVATELGVQFANRLEPDDAHTFNQFSLGRTGHSRKSHNVIVADSGRLRIVLFDHKFSSGGGKNSSTYHQSVVMVRAHDRMLPKFTLAPETWLHRFGELVGMSDIDFDEDPEFSSAFSLRAPDEDAVRAFFTAQRRRAWLKWPDVHVEADGDTFLFYRRGRRTKPEKIKQLMEEAWELYQVLN